ncbi:alpha/beta fold hydrolase [Streptomyces sp. NPDC016734]|uniref:alpha/beta fold hydrolase n=1 Tax=Streptomyces TaxID=1883 RepID=UPI00099B2E78
MSSPLDNAPTEYLQRPDGARLALHLTGDADPDLVVVLGHGWQTTAAVWATFAHALYLPGIKIQVVRFDQRGHGDSTSGTSRAEISVLADDLAAIIETTVPRGVPILLGGYSMGAMAVLGLSARHPHLIGTRVKAVFLTSATLGGLDLTAKEHPLRRRALGRMRRVVVKAAERAPQPARFMRDAMRPRPYKQPEISVTAAWFHALMEHDVTGKVSALQRVPVHIVVGEQDPVTGPVHALRLAHEIPGARIHLVRGGGHRLPMMSPAEVEAVLHLACTQAVEETVGVTHPKVKTTPVRSWASHHRERAMAWVRRDELRTQNQ